MTASSYSPDVRVELALDSNYATPAASRTWTDISDKVELGDRIAITRGRADESSVCEPNRCALTLDNTDGRFTAGKTGGAYYPNIKIGKPIRVRCRWPLGTAGNMHPNPSAETDATGWTTSTLLGSNDLATSVTRSTFRAFSGAASIRAVWPTTVIGSNAGAFVTGHVVGRTYIASAYVWVSSGGNPDVYLNALFLTSSSTTALKDQWVRLSTTYVATADSVYLSVRCATATAGQECYVDAVMVDEGTTLQAYTATPPPIYDRYTGYVDEWPVNWDGSDAYAVAHITATSRMARLGLGAELRSVVEEEYLIDAPDAYFTLGEPDGSVSASNTTKNGVGVLATTQLGTGGELTFGANTGPGTDGLTAPAFLPVSVTAGKYLAGPVSAGFYGLTLEAFINTTAAVQQTIARVSDPAGNYLDLSVNAAGKLRATDWNAFLGTSNFDLLSGPVVNDGATHHVQVAQSVSGGVVTVEIRDNGVLKNSTTYAGTAVAFWTRITVGGTPTGALFTGTISHVAVQSDSIGVTRATAHANAGLTGFAGETAALRITRYAGYAGIPSTELNLSGGTATVDHIEISGHTALDNMRTVEQTESGVLFDARDNRLTFAARADRYNTVSAFTLTAATQQIEADVTQNLDRSTLVNDVTATASDGTTVRVVNQASIDAYGYARQTVEVAANINVAQSAAAWRVGTYGEPQPRIPNLGVDWMPLGLTAQQNLFNADVGTRFTAAGLPAQAQATTVDFFIEGYTETIGVESYDFAFNVSPFTGFDVWILEDATFGAYDTYPLAY